MQVVKPQPPPPPLCRIVFHFPTRGRPTKTKKQRLGKRGNVGGSRVIQIVVEAGQEVPRTLVRASLTALCTFGEGVTAGAPFPLYARGMKQKVFINAKYHS